MPLPLAPTTTEPLFAPAESRELSAPTVLLNYWHLASLDASTVALAWTLAFAWAVHVRLPLWILILIPLAVWSVYVGDRILDAYSGLRAGSPARLRERHFFHWRHRLILLPLGSASAAAAACIIFSFMPLGSRQRDSFLVAASFLYFTRVHTRRYAAPFLSKEFLVGLLFTIGCLLPAFSRATLPLTLLVPATLFVLLAWLNCHAIELWESVDGLVNRRSIAAIATLLALTNAVLAAALVSSHPREAALLACASLSAILLALLDRLRIRIPAVTLRASADLVLLTPILLVPLARFFRQ